MFDFPQIRRKHEARDYRHQPEPEVASCLGTKFDNGEVRKFYLVESRVLRQTNIEMFLKNMEFRGMKASQSKELIRFPESGECSTKKFASWLA